MGVYVRKLSRLAAMAAPVLNWRELAPAIASLLVWLFLNCSLNFYNKWLFSHTEFKFPVFFTMFHMVANLIGTSILIFVFKQGQVDFSTSGKHYGYKFSILLLASLFCTNIVTNNWSLMYISLSVNQIVKSCLPIPTIILSMMFEGKTYSLFTFLSIAVIVGCSMDNSLQQAAGTKCQAEFHHPCLLWFSSVPPH